MQSIICPIDGTPCAPGCSDRFHDREEGGCLLTLAKSMGAHIQPIQDKCTLIIFTPEEGDEP